MVERCLYHCYFNHMWGNFPPRRTAHAEVYAIRAGLFLRSNLFKVSLGIFAAICNVDLVSNIGEGMIQTECSFWIEVLREDSVTERNTILKLAFLSRSKTTQT